MFPFSFKNRIAFNYLVSTALMVLFVFVIIYNIVLFTVYSHIDDNLGVEVNDHLSEITIEDDYLKLVDPEEWNEQEHNTLNVNPVFVEILDHNRKIVGKSPNLKLHTLRYNYTKEDYRPFDAMLANENIRQVEFKVKYKGKVAGYVLIAMSLEEPQIVLKNLGRVLWISYPIILLLLFFTARFIAGRNIKPIQSITETAKIITRDNLISRIELPQNKDELYVLSQTINELLERIQNAILREKLFTSDASHELRTPLAVIKGTLEVLIRKPREKQEYEEKIKYCISEVDRLNNLIDQLLLLARFENQKIAINKRSFDLDELVLESLKRFSSQIKARHITIDFTFEEHFQIISDASMVSTIIENLLSNALKYSHEKGKISIFLSMENGAVCFKIKDNGIGIPKEDLDKIYEKFYRSQAIIDAPIKGTGLGLSIVKRLSDLLQISLHIESVQNSGTTVTIIFPK